MIPITLSIGAKMAPLIPKYSDIFEYNGLKAKLPENYEELVRKGENVKIKLISLP